MKVVNLGENASVLNNFIAEMRDAVIQKDRLRFRTNLERVGEIFAYEISKTLTYSEKDVVKVIETLTFRFFLLKNCRFSCSEEN